MIDPQSEVALRLAATLTHTAPFLSARVLDRGRTVLHVATDASEPDDGLGAASCTPCQFRRAVIGVHRGQVAPGGLLEDLSHQSRLSVEVSAEPCGETFRGGLHRVAVGPDLHLWLFAVPLSSEDAYELGRDLVRSSPGVLCRLDAFGIRGDTGTGTSVAYARTTAMPNSKQERELIELLESLLACWSVHALLEALAEEDPRNLGSQ